MVDPNTILSMALAGAADGAALSFHEPVRAWADAVIDAPELTSEAWRDALLPAWGRHDAKDTESKAFIGKMLARNVYGFAAMHVTSTAHRIVRTQRDARLDGMGHYSALFVVAGRVTVVQNEQSVELTAGDTLLIDSGRAVTYITESNYGHGFVLQLPRRELVSHLGFEPRFAQDSCRNRQAGRLLFQLVRDIAENEESASAAAGNYLRLAIYDLLGALSSATEPSSGSLHSEKLFSRVCNIVRDRFNDSSLTPSEVAAEARISLRYLQKLFTMRDLTYTQFINSVRLDYAASLLQRRAFLSKDQPISEIAYASGFGDYPHFAKTFRRRFGHAPGVHAKHGY